MIIGQIAMICHEVNRAYCRSIGDHSQQAWADAPEWQKESAVNGVEFHLSNETTPEQSHENWMREKAADGWVYGPVKDPEKKEHPCMVPYDQLPLEQRTKDYLFKAVVDCFK
ncbi:RyR domain protein [compost metagenome]